VIPFSTFGQNQKVLAKRNKEFSGKNLSADVSGECFL
jgi:hypothetical protein